MKVLLDTHVWVWTQEQPEKIGTRSRGILLDPANELLISSISTLEIARMVACGRLVFTKDLRRWIRDGLAALGAVNVAVDDETALEAYDLTEPFHRDPADRVLVATARLQDCTLLSADRLILGYAHVSTTDARE